MVRLKARYVVKLPGNKKRGKNGSKLMIKSRKDVKSLQKKKKEKFNVQNYSF